MVGIMIELQSPRIINNLFSKNDFLNIQQLFINPKKFQFQSGFSRWVVSGVEIPVLNIYACSLTNLARNIFNSKELIPTYCLFSHYESKHASLYRHKDDNACTYTIDMCVYQKYAWDIYVEGIPYTLYPNQALAYYGNDQEHWREAFPEPKTNYVAMIFFHFAEPDHWYFNEGPSYLDRVIKAKPSS